jgi:hypothetical protein
MASDEKPDTRDETPRTGLYANEPRRDLDGVRVLKVKLPIAQHIQLHSMRVYRGEGISETVTAALQMYFERLREPALAQPTAGEAAG